MDTVVPNILRGDPGADCGVAGRGLADVRSAVTCASADVDALCEDCPLDSAESASPRKIDDVLAQEGFYMGPPVGVSMWPMLRNRTDVILVRPAEGRLSRYDVALYHRGSAYVLHRVVGYYDKGYIILGDNCVQREYVPFEDVFGVLEGFYRDGTYVDCRESKGYHAYSKAWVATFPLRKAGKQSVALAKRAVRAVVPRAGRKGK